MCTAHGRDRKRILAKDTKVEGNILQSILPQKMREERRKPLFLDLLVSIKHVPWVTRFANRVQPQCAATARSDSSGALLYNVPSNH